MAVVDLAFELSGASIPLDHGYALYGALSRIVPALHEDGRIGVHPIRGVNAETRRLTLGPGRALDIPVEDRRESGRDAGEILELVDMAILRLPPNDRRLIRQIYGGRNSPDGQTVQNMSQSPVGVVV